MKHAGMGNHAGLKDGGDIVANYYMQDGRYFGEDTSFYEFDEDCLRKKGDLWRMDEDPKIGGIRNDTQINRLKNVNDHSQSAEIPQENICGREIRRDRADGDPEETVCTGPDRKKSEHTCEACSSDADPPESFPDPPGDFDRLFTTRRLDMLKTAIPFLPTRQQKAFACAVKLVEFRNLVSYFGQNEPALLGACSDENPQMRMADMLDALRGYCSPAEQEQMDSLFQVLLTVQMMREGI